MKHTYVILVQSSVNIANHRDPPKVETLDGDQTSEQISIKESGLLFNCSGNEA